MTIEFISVVALLGFFIGSIEIIKRRFRVKSDTSRKIAHIGAALITFATPFLLSKWEIISIGLIFAGLLLVTRRTGLFLSIHSVERRTFGEIFWPVGVVLGAFFFLPERVSAFQFGVLVMGLSDALAALIGERFGKHPLMILGNKKSVEGSFAFFASCLALISFFVPRFSYQNVVVALILTGAEFFLVLGIDNLVLPILGAYLVGFLF